MITYLTIITTVLVVTQIIRVTQNYLQLKKQEILIRSELDCIEDITQEDLEQKRETYKMLYKWLRQNTRGDSENENH